MATYNPTGENPTDLDAQFDSDDETVDVPVAFVHDVQQRVTELEENDEQKDAMIQSLFDKIEGLEPLQADSTQQVIDYINNLEGGIEKRDRIIDEQQELIDGQDEQLDNKDEVIEGQEEIIDNKDEIIDGQEEIIGEQQDRLNEQQQIVEELQERHEEITEEIDGVKEIIDDIFDIGEFPAERDDLPDNIVIVDDEDTTVEDIEDLKERIDENEQQAMMNESRVNGLNDGLDRVDETVEDVEDDVDGLEQDRDVHDSRITAVSDGIDRLEANDGDTNHGGDDGDTTLHRPMTPLERLLDDPQNSGIRITPSVDRAMKIASRIDQWSEKVPAGHVVRDGLNKLLSTVEEESLAWKQIHRACHKLDELTDGRISFEDTDQHGRVLVMRDESYLSRVVSAGGGG